MGKIRIEGFGVVEIAGDRPTAEESAAIARAISSQQGAPSPAANAAPPGGQPQAAAAPAPAPEPQLTPAGLDPNSWWDYVPGVSQARDVMDYAAAGGGWQMPASVTERNAEANAATQTAGTLAAGAAPGGGALLPSMMGRIGQNAALGAAEGAAMGQVAGTGALDDMTLAERGQQALSDAALGGALGGAGSYLAELIGGGLPATAGADLAERMGIRATRGQARGVLSELQKEESLRQAGGVAGNVMRRFDEGQAADIERAVGRIFPGADMPSAETARTVLGNLADAAATSRGRVSAAYDKVGELTGWVDPRAMDELATRAGNIIDDPFTGYSDPKVRDPLMGLVKRFQDARGRAEGAGISMQQVEGLRKSINRDLDSATDPSIKSGLREIKGAFDGWLDDVMATAQRPSAPSAPAGVYRPAGPMLEDGSKRLALPKPGEVPAEAPQRVKGQPRLAPPAQEPLYLGDPNALQVVRSARAEAARHGATFGSKGGSDPAGQMIKRLVSETGDPDQAIGVLFQRGSGAGLGKRGTVEAVNRIERASPQAFNALQQAGWARIVRAPNGGMKSPTMIAKGIEIAFEQNPTLMRRLYGPDVSRQMQDLATALRAIEIPADARNMSRSGHTLVSAFMNAAPILAGGSTAYSTGDWQAGLQMAALASAPRVARAVRATRVVKPLPRTRPHLAAATRAAGIGSAGLAAQEEQ